MIDEPVEVRIEAAGCLARVEVGGEIDDSNVASLISAFSGLADQSLERIDVDLTNVDYLGSAGVRALVQAADHAGGALVRIVAASDIVLRVLELSGVIGMLVEPRPPPAADHR
jgi:anti-anti-sigma factor